MEERVAEAKAKIPSAKVRGLSMIFDLVSQNSRPIKCLLSSNDLCSNSVCVIISASRYREKN